MTRKTKTYIWQFVIGVGFLSGLWTAVGIDPEDVILNMLGTAIDMMYPDPNIRYIFLILPALLLLTSVISAYMGGRIFGLTAVIVAYGAGLSILVSITTAFLLLLLAMAIGYIATNRSLKKKFTVH